MTQVQLQVRPRRVRCERAAPPPPFEFTAGSRGGAARPARPAMIERPLRVITGALSLLGRVIDLAFFLVVLTTWCALHLVLWSFAFDLGPAADCANLPCPAWVGQRVLLLCGALAVLTFAVARFLRRLGHRATAGVLLLLVTFDVAALLLLAAHQISA